MNCEHYRAQLPEYWDGALDEGDRLILEAHLAACAGCREEAENLASIWTRLAEIPQEFPDAALRTRFYDRLEAYRSGFAESERTPKKRTFSLRGSWLNPAWQAAVAAGVLAIGFAVGYRANTGRDNGEVSQLRSEVNNMRQMVTLSLLQQQSASERLRGVNYAFRVQQSDTEVLAALLSTIDHDPNINVRLAAVDAMRTFADSPVARKGLVQAIRKQDSPMVQIAIIDQLTELHDTAAAPALSALSRDANINAEVRHRAQWALQYLH
jgi:HEAT repeats/Putative zinc-finger